jgi:hypothetical protein
MTKSIVFGLILFWWALILSSIAAWVTHVVHTLINGEWGFLIAGAILAPIGVIHGWLIWFGIA